MHLSFLSSTAKVSDDSVVFASFADNTRHEFQLGIKSPPSDQEPILKARQIRRMPSDYPASGGGFSVFIAPDCNSLKPLGGIQF